MKQKELSSKTAALAAHFLLLIVKEWTLTSVIQTCLGVTQMCKSLCGNTQIEDSVEKTWHGVHLCEQSGNKQTNRKVHKKYGS